MTDNTALGVALAAALARRDLLESALMAGDSVPAAVAHQVEGDVRRAEADLVRARAERVPGRADA